MLASLMLGRAGHNIVLIEQDGLDVAPDVEVAATEAYRPAAPQLVQPHIVMARCRLILTERLPDVLVTLLEAGAVESSLSDQAPAAIANLARQHDDDKYRIVMTRRSTLDWVLRRAVLAEPGVEVRTARAVGLCALPGHPPHVTGVTTDSGEVLGDVIVDASGRRSAIDRWLEELAAQPADRSSAECGVTYYGRHYRIVPGAAPLPGSPTTRSVVGYDIFTAVLFCSDNEAVQTAVVPLTADRRFRPLATEHVYDSVLRIIPTHIPWMEVLKPISPVRQMVAPHNSLRRLVVNGAPVVTGLLTIGDALCTTNPTFGRGLSLAAWVSADLVEVLEQHPDDPVSQAVALDARIAEHVVPYYLDQAATDSARLAMLRHSILGTPRPASSGGQGVTFPALRSAAAVDVLAYRALWSLLGMLRRPEDVYQDPEVVAAVREAHSHGLPAYSRGPDPSGLFAALNP